MTNLLIVNGEQDWQQYFPGIHVYQCRLQTSQWLFHGGHLWMLDDTGSVRVDAVLWRVGAILPEPWHHTVLEMIRYAGIPCTNAAATLLKGYDRISMLNILQECGVPTNPSILALGAHATTVFQPEFPVIIKIGNLHGGWGKARAVSQEQWDDMTSLAYAAHDYVTIEPYLTYVNDIRCLLIGEKMWAMTRRANSWKANVETVSYALIDPPEILQHYTLRIRDHTQADIIGVDYLELEDHQYITLEYNDVPGLSGFPDEARWTLAHCMLNKIS